MKKKMSPADLVAAAKRPRVPKSGKGRYHRPIWTCRLREIRESKRLTIVDVATGIGMSHTAIWQIEYGCDPCLTTAVKIAEFFGMAIPEIWTGRA